MPPLTAKAMALYTALADAKGHHMGEAHAHPQFNGYWRSTCASCGDSVTVRVIPGREQPLDVLTGDIAFRVRCGDARDRARIVAEMRDRNVVVCDPGETIDAAVQRLEAGE